MKLLKGLTWKHLRAVDSLRVSALVYKQNCGVEIVWDIRDLSKFEHQPMESIIQNYDFIVYDHPFSGILSAYNYFVPLHALNEHNALCKNSYIGQSLMSYYYKENQWGIPIDGATNHAVYRADLLEKQNLEIPESWSEVIELGKKIMRTNSYIGMAVKGHHGLLIVAALCANMGSPWSTDEKVAFEIDKETLKNSVQLVKEMLSYANKEAVDWNSIDLHNAMVVRDDIVFCPCVYGFAVYGEDYVFPRRLSFGNFTGYNKPYYSGSVLGGTAIGLSSASHHRDESMKYIAWLSEAEVQKNILSCYHGQGARIEVWNDVGLNNKYNKFYSSIRNSMETAWMRPRFVGYQNFEQKSGGVLERFFRDEISENKATHDIMELSHTEFISW